MYKTHKSNEISAFPFYFPDYAIFSLIIYLIFFNFISGYPLIMLSLLLLTGLSLLCVVMNVAQIVAGFRSLPIYQTAVEEFGITSLSSFGAIGVFIEGNFSFTVSETTKILLIKTLKNFVSLTLQYVHSPNSTMIFLRMLNFAQPSN